MIKLAKGKIEYMKPLLQSEQSDIMIKDSMRVYRQIVSNKEYKDSESMVTKANDVVLERINGTIMTIIDHSRKYFEGVIPKARMELCSLCYSMYPITISKVIYQQKQGN